jgi:hypothetical protein
MLARRLRPITAALLMGLLGAACADRDVATAPVQPTAQNAHSADLLGLGAVVASATRLVCPLDTPISATAVVGPQGGTIEAGGVKVEFPAGAVADSQAFSLRLVPGDYVDLELGAVGFEHYSFARPVTVSLNLARCGSLPLGLHAWYVDGDTKTLVEDMGGEVDLLGRTLRFRTPHFSGYTVAW